MTAPSASTPANELPLVIYTDGSCIGNPGPGGWGVLMRRADGVEKELSGSEPDTTNNRMELMAAIAALEFLVRPRVIELHTDSTYVHNGITKWVKGWESKGWRNSGGAVKNKELWQRLQAANARHKVKWHWVRAHNGNPDNERVDMIARYAAEHATRVG
ncbi:MAG: ribonuclease HI [Pseudomarimonas sp.]